ncbi:MAG TPA: CpaF family protein, partial [Polyangia bacterium]
MSLSERLKQSSAARASGSGDVGQTVDLEIYHQLKSALHARVVDRLDLESLQQLSPELLKQEIGNLLGTMVTEGNMPLNRREREQMVQELLDEILGLGPLESLLRDLTISDILVNTFNTIYVERRGRLETTGLRFRDNDHLQQTINRIVARVGRRVDETSPMVDARLPDGSRVNAIIPPLAVDGPILSIRRFGGAPLRIADLLQLGAITEPMRAFVDGCVKARLNILISGGTGTGKTTMLNALSSFIPSHERVITIEDAAELQLQQTHVVRLETRPANVEGKGEIVTRDLVRNSLRMRPDRIVVGEVRGPEALDMLQAMNTGHDGSLSTAHANSPRDALARVETMVLMAGFDLPVRAIREQVAGAVDLVVQVARLRDGSRRVIGVS